MDNPASWRAGQVPGTNDSALFNFRFSTDSNAVLSLGSTTSWWGQLQMDEPGTNLIITAGSALGLLGLSSTGIDLSAAIYDLTFEPRVILMADQIWNVTNRHAIWMNGDVENMQGVQVGLTKAGGGTIYLSGSNTFGGADVTNVVLAGTLVVASPNGLGDPGNTLMLRGGTAVLASAIAPFAYTTVVAGASGLVVESPATGGTGMAYSLGPLSVSASSLNLLRGTNFVSGVGEIDFPSTRLMTNLAFNVGTNVQVDLGALSGAYALVRSGPGVWNITQPAATTRTNAASAVTNLSGRLVLATPNALGSTGVPLTVSGSVLDLAADSSVAAYSLFTRGAVTVTPNRATAGAAGIVHALGRLTIGSNTLYVAPGSNVTGAAAGLTFGSVALTGVVTFSVASNVTLRLGAVSGAYELVKSGPGLLVLTNAAESGRTGTASVVTLTTGELRLAHVSAVGVTSAPIVLQGGRLSLAMDTSVNPYNVTVGGSAAIESGRATAASPGITNVFGTLAVGAQTLSVAAGTNVSGGRAGVAFGYTTFTSAPPVFDVASNVVLLPGSLRSTGAFTKIGSGVLTLNAAPATNRTGGQVTLSEGTVWLGQTNALGSTGVTVKLTSGLLDLATDTSVAPYALTVSGDATLAADKATAASAGIVHSLGALTLAGGSLTVTSGVNVGSGTASVRFASAVLSNSTSLLVYRPAGAAASVSVGTLAGAGSGGVLTLGGDGAVVQTGIWSGPLAVTLGANFSGTATLSQANTFTGDVTLAGGTLRVAGAGALPDGAGRGTLRFAPASGSAVLDLAGSSEVINGLGSSGAGTAIIDSSSGGAVTLTVGSNHESSTFSGVLRNTAGTLSLVKLGTGVLTLAGSASTFSGSVAVLEGTLAASSVVVQAGMSSLGNATSAVVLGASSTTGTLSYLGGDATYTRGFVLGAAGGVIHVATTSATLTLAGPVNNSSGGLFTVTGPGQSTLSGALGSGSGGLRKLGDGLLTIAGATNAYTGRTSIEQGSVRISSLATNGGRSAFGNATTAITLGGTTAVATLLYAGSNATFTRGLTLGAGGGRIECETSGQTLTLAGAAIDDASGGQLTLGGAGSWVMTAALSGGAGGLIKTGSGSLLLSGGVNTYSGQTVLQQGVVTAAVIATYGGRSDFGNAGSAIVLGGTTSPATLVYSGVSDRFTRGFVVGAAGGRLDIAASDAVLTIDIGDITMAAGGDLTLGGAGDVVMASVVRSGAGGLSKLGAGTLTLLASNAFSGAVSLAGGRTLLEHAGALGASSAGVTVGAGATLDLRAQNILTMKPLSISGEGTDGNGALVNSASRVATWPGLVTVSDRTTLGGPGDVTLRGGLAGKADLTKVSTNLLVLSGDGRAYSGTLRISAGGLMLDAADALGQAVGGTEIADGAWLDLNGQDISTAEPLTLSGVGDGRNGALGNTSRKASRFAGPVTLSATTQVAGAGDISLTGALDGKADLEKITANTLVLSGASTAYAGEIRVQAGRLRLGHGSALGDATGATVVSEGATLDLYGTTVDGAEPLQAGGYGLDGAGVIVNLGPATAGFAGPWTLTAPSAVGGSGDLLLSGTVGGNFNLTKTGTNIVTLAGDNAAFTNGLFVSNGVLRVGHAAALGTVDGVTRVQSGASLDFNGIDITNAERLLIGGAGRGGAGVLINEGGREIFLATSIELQTNATIGGTYPWNTSGDVTGNFSLTKTGPNDIDLNGVVAHGGSTMVTNGVLHFAHITSTGDVVVTGRGWLGGTGTVDHAVIVTNGGTISPGHPEVGQLRVGSLVLNSNAHLDVEIHVTGAHDVEDTNNVESHEDIIDVTQVNGLTLNGGQVHLQPEGTTNTFDTSGRYPLFHVKGDVIGSVSNLTVANPSGGKEYFFGRFGTTVVVTIRTIVGWDGLGAFHPEHDLTWRNPDNWAYNNVPSNYDVVVFTGNSSGLTNYFNLGPNFVAGGITFTNGAGRFMVRQQNNWPPTLRLAGTLLNMSAETMTFELPFNLDDSSQHIVCSNGALVLRGNIGEHDPGYGLIKDGGEDLVLAGTNSFSGVTVLNNGVLSLGSPGALASTGAIQFAGGTLQFSEQNTNDYSARIRNSSAAIRLDDNGQNLTLGSSLDASNTNGLTKLGTGTLHLAAANAFGGTLRMEEGVVRFSSLANFGNASAIEMGGATLR